MWVCGERAAGQRASVRPGPPLPSAARSSLRASTCLVQGRLLHQLEGGLVDAAVVKTDRLAQLLLFPGLDLRDRGGQSLPITEPPMTSDLQPDPRQPSQPHPRP